MGVVCNRLTIKPRQYFRDRPIQSKDDLNVANRVAAGNRNSVLGSDRGCLNQKGITNASFNLLDLLNGFVFSETVELQ